MVTAQVTATSASGSAPASVTGPASPLQGLLHLFSSLNASLLSRISSLKEFQFNDFFELIRTNKANAQDITEGIVNDQDYKEEIRQYIDRLEELARENWITQEQLKFIKEKTLYVDNTTNLETNFDPSDPHCYLGPVELAAYLERIESLKNGLVKKYPEDLDQAKLEFQVRLGLGIAAGGAHGFVDELVDANVSNEEIWKSSAHFVLVDILTKTKVSEDGSSVDTSNERYDQRNNRILNQEGLLYLHENFKDYLPTADLLLPANTDGSVSAKNVEQLVAMWGASVKTAVERAFLIKGIPADDEQVKHFTAVCLGVMMQESKGQHTYSDGSFVESVSGAVGLMQLMPATAGQITEDYKHLNLDYYNLSDNLLMGVIYLLEHENTYGIYNKEKGFDFFGLSTLNSNNMDTYGDLLRAYNGGISGENWGSTETSNYPYLIEDYIQGIIKLESFTSLFGEEGGEGPNSPAVSPGNPSA